MDKVLTFFSLIIYLLIISYISSMVVFDFKKYILKDEFLKDMKFCFNWKEKYNYNKAMSNFKLIKKSEINDDIENIDTSK